MTVRFESSRHFQVWAYTVSHAQLILRSNKTDLIDTRVDILFKVVRAMRLPTLLHGLTIEECSMDHAAELGVQLEPHETINISCFVLRGANFDGYVIAGAVFFHEDRGSFQDDSHFQPSFPFAVRI